MTDASPLLLCRLTRPRFSGAQVAPIMCVSHSTIDQNLVTLSQLTPKCPSHPSSPSHLLSTVPTHKSTQVAAPSQRLQQHPAHKISAGRQQQRPHHQGHKEAGPLPPSLPTSIYPSVPAPVPCACACACPAARSLRVTSRLLSCSLPACLACYSPPLLPPPSSRTPTTPTYRRSFTASLHTTLCSCTTASHPLLYTHASAARRAHAKLILGARGRRV